MHYLENCPRNFDIVFDEPLCFSNFNEFIPKTTCYKREIVAQNVDKKIIRLREQEIKETTGYHDKINQVFCMDNAIPKLAKSYHYVILYHGGNKLINYLTSLDSYSNGYMADFNKLRKIILINDNHIFDSLLEQYEILEKRGLGGLSSMVQVVDSLDKCLPILEEVHIR